MKRVIKETLNEKVFVEFYAEINEGKIEYYVSALFRFTHRSRTDKMSFEKANAVYNYIINN